MLSDSFQSDFINCVLHALQPVCSMATLLVYIGEGLEVDRILGTFMSSSVRTGAHHSIVRIELGRSTASTAVSILLSATNTKKHTYIPVRKMKDHKE